jgi:cytolysin (calcineurin-like family phosphatase)
MRDAALAARLEVAARTVADLDRRLGQIDLTIEEAAKRGRTTTAFTAIEAARKTREVLEAQRQREGKTLADLKAERAALGAKGRQIETEDAPIRYVAELLGAEADSERAIR